MAANELSVDLGLPATPETQNAELFKELLRIYNAINILATGVDKYTQDGNVVASIQALDTAVAAINATLDAGTIPLIHSPGNFGVNGKAAQAAVTMPAAATDLATAIALVNVIRTTLIANGIGA